MFKTMTGCLDPRKNPSEEEINKIPSYVFCRWLSGSPYTIMAANEINKNSDIPMVSQYNMIKSAFAGKIKYIPYPKNVGTDSIKKVDYLVEHFKISEEKAIEYLDLISQDELQYIINMYDEYYLKHPKRG